MKCKFCGAEINEEDIRCASCGGELERITDPEENLKIIDEMPELHDELDKIGEMREKTEGRKKRVIIAIIIVLVCLLASFLGMYFVKSRTHEEPAAEEIVPVTSAVPGGIIKITEGEGFTDVSVIDEMSAISAVNSLRSRLGITDERTSFKLESQITVGSDTYYRLGQYCGNLRVYNGEMVIMVSEDGTPLMINGTYVETDGVDLDAEVDVGNASNGATEYINRLSKDYCLKEGVTVSAPKKVIYNFEENTYLAYLFKASGYNDNGAFISYDVLTDADSGNGICYRATSSFENGDDEIVEVSEKPDIRGFSESPATYYMVNDKFNWSDETKTSAVDPIDTESINAGETSLFVSEAKKSIDKAYTYFKENFLWEDAFSRLKVYINANEYVEHELPPEKAIYSDGIITLIEEDLINIKADPNVVTHEYSHMMMQDIANFDGTMAYSESSAIAEGYADVFGELSELYFTGEADWIHGERNVGMPIAPYLDAYREDTAPADMPSVYRNSTIISHALCKMYAAAGINEQIVGEVMYRTVCMMNKDTTFAEWRTITEATLYQMMKKGAISEQQFAKSCEALVNTGISAGKIYASEAVTPEVLEDTQSLAG